MAVWRYAWTIAPLLTVVALGTGIAIQAAAVLGGAVITIGLLGLLLVLLKEKIERPERRTHGIEASRFRKLRDRALVWLLNFLT